MGFARKVIGAAEGLHPHSLIMGRKASAGVNLAGQLAGSYDDLYQPRDVPAIPTSDTQSGAIVERDRVRRLARRAQGQQSTIRSSTSLADGLYPNMGKSLLGS